MFAPTADQRNTVKIMAGLGVSQDKICLSVVNAATGKPVSEPTSRRAFQREIDSGQTELITLVGNMLANTALGRPSAVGEPIKSDAARVQRGDLFYEPCVLAAGFFGGAHRQGWHPEATPGGRHRSADRCHSTNPRGGLPTFGKIWFA
jgi:hypothetical protein